MYVRVCAGTGRQLGRQAGQADGWTDRRTDGRTGTRTHAHTRTQTHTHAHTRTHACMCACVHMRKCVRMRTRQCVCVCVYAWHPGSNPRGRRRDKTTPGVCAACHQHRRIACVSALRTRPSGLFFRYGAVLSSTCHFRCHVPTACCVTTSSPE